METYSEQTNCWNMCKLNILHIKLAVLTHFILDSVRL